MPTASCKDKKLTIDHYTNFLWCKEHDQAGAILIEGLEQLHAEKLAVASFGARVLVQEHMSALSHISNPSHGSSQHIHTKLMISLRCMNFSADTMLRCGCGLGTRIKIKIYS